MNLIKNCFAAEFEALCNNSNSTVINGNFLFDYGLSKEECDNIVQQTKNLCANSKKTVKRFLKGPQSYERTPQFKRDFLRIGGMVLFIFMYFFLHFVKWSDDHTNKKIWETQTELF
jgi:hypothetical protein